MSNHTPGPWFYWGSGGTDYTVFATVPKPGGREPFDLDHEVLGTSEWVRVEEANARLIAAAPDLLEALKSVEWIVGAGGPAFCADCGHYRSNGHSKHCKLAAAIAKAEGR